MDDVLFGGMLISLCLPLSTIIGFDGFRVYFFDVWLVALVISGAVAAIGSRFKRTDRSVSRGVDWVERALGALVTWFIVGGLFAYDRTAVYERAGLWIRGLFIYRVTSRRVGRTLSVERILRAVAWIFICEGGICLLQLATGSDIGALNKYFGGASDLQRTFDTDFGTFIRVQGTFFNTGIIAEWACLWVSLLMTQYMVDRRGRGKTSLLLGWISCLFCALFTYYRSAWSAIFIGIVGSIWCVSRSRRNASVRRATVIQSLGILIVVTVAGIIVSWLADIKVLDALVWRAGSFEGRVEKKYALIKYAGLILQQNWLWGVGLGNFFIHLQETDYLYYFYTHKGGAVHNIPALIAAESGVVGGGLFVISCGLAIGRSLRVLSKKNMSRKELLGSAASVGVLAMLWQMQWSLMFVHHSVMPVFFVVFGLSRVAGQASLVKRGRD